MTDEKLAQMIQEYVDMKMKSTIADYDKQIDVRFDEVEANIENATDGICLCHNRSEVGNGQYFQKIAAHHHPIRSKLTNVLMHSHL